MLEEKERIIACIILHALGDTIGFKNGEWEFNYGSNDKHDILKSITNEILYEFIELGGINDISLKGWHISDDTLFHMVVMESITSDYRDIDDLLKITISKHIHMLSKMKDDENNGIHRYPGNTTIKNIQKLKNGVKIPYNINDGGAGAAMKTLCIGLLYDDVSNIMKISIEISRLTHNSTIGYLGGFVSALFTHYALKQIPINMWPFKLLEIFDSNAIDDYIRDTHGIEYFKKDKEVFIDKWKKYIDDKFEDKLPKYKKSSRHLIYRMDYYKKNISSGKIIGSVGDDSVIIAYDCLLDSKKSWEKLVIYSMLNIGDSDTLGCIAGGWYGALYGMDRVPKKNLKYLEMKSDIIELANKLIKKKIKN